MKQIAVILAVVLVLFLLWKKLAKPKVKQQTDSPDDSQIIDDVVISYGSSGMDVRRLQMKLNEMIARASAQEILVSYSLDGITYHQITQPLVVDGKFGRATETMLFATTGRKSVKASEIDDLSLAPSA